MAWRQPAPRVADVVNDETGRLWYVSGETGDAATLILYRVQAATGGRQEIARWKRPSDVTLVMIAYASGRLFVAALSQDLGAMRAGIGIDCFDAASGTPLWRKSHELSGKADVVFPLGLFMPHGEGLVYSVGHDVFTIRADGTEIDRQHENDIILPNILRVSAPSGPVHYVNDKRQIVTYDNERKELTRKPGPELNSPRLVIRNGVLFGFNDSSAFAFDLATDSEKWRVAGKFRTVADGEDHVLALREDNVLLRLDRETGKVIGEHPTLWRPSGFAVIRDRFYAFTADGLAYSIRL